MNVTLKTVKRIAVVTAFLLLIACLSYAYWQRRQTVVTVANKSGQDVDSVELVLNDARYALGRLQAGETRSVRVFPHGKSVLRVTFGIGALTKTSAAMQVEPSGGSRPKIEIGKQGAVECSYIGFIGSKI